MRQIDFDSLPNGIALKLRKPYVPVSVLAYYTGVSEKTVRRLVADWEVPYIMDSKTMKVDRDAFLRLLHEAANSHCSTTQMVAHSTRPT